MSDRTDKERSDALARQLSGVGVDRARLLETIAALHAGETEPLPEREDYVDELIESVSGDTPIPIGIWNPEPDDAGESRFRRDPTAITRHWWPPHEVLTAKRTLLPLRVCLLGESTSAGWFYAPVATPAKFLQGQLNATRGTDTFEVIDLSMVNLQPRALVGLMAAVTQLAPDVVVVFAGNNWAQRCPTFPDVRFSDVDAAVSAIRTDGAAALSTMAIQRTARNAQRAVDSIARIADVFGLTVVVVVPEVNLRDWSRARPVAWLASDDSRRWHELHRRAMTSANDHDFHAVAKLAASMCTLDGGSSPTSLELYAHAELALGNTEHARDLLERAVDARTWDNFPSVPSATRVVQSALRSSREHGFRVVDLPALFREELDGGLPDRRVFLDYCHLTLDGMRSAMAAVAEQVLVLAGPAASAVPSRREIRDSFELTVPPAVDSQIKFMSLLYGAHYGCDYEPYEGDAVYSGSRISIHWLEQSRSASPEVDELLGTYVHARSVPLHAFGISADRQRMHLSLSDLESQTAQAPGLDADVVRLLVDTLSAAGKIDRDEVVDQLVDSHSVELSPIDLCNAVHLWSLAEQQQDGGGYGINNSALITARWPNTHFCFVAGGERPLELLVTVRLPLVAVERQDQLVLAVNGNVVGEMSIDTSWTRGWFEIPSGTLERGYNKLTLRWPPLPGEGDHALARIVERLEVGVPVDLHPSFGEVHTLRVAVRNV